MKKFDAFLDWAVNLTSRLFYPVIIIAILLLAALAHAAAPVTLATIQSGGVVYHRQVPAGTKAGDTVRLFGIGRLGVPSTRIGKVISVN